MQIVDISSLSFDENGLIPAIVQNIRSKEVLMLAYMNRASLELSLKTGETWFYSRSRQELWHKGAQSGNTQKIERITYDCDADTLLLEVTPAGPACHTGEQSCFYREMVSKPVARPALAPEDMLQKLYTLITDRKNQPIDGSYTNYLFTSGLDKILKKVGEETAEVIIGAKNRRKSELVYEIADLTYHMLVLMVELDCTPSEIAMELNRRYERK